jgi:hypothetical protein
MRRWPGRGAWRRRRSQCRIIVTMAITAITQATGVLGGKPVLMLGEQLYAL